MGIFLCGAAALFAFLILGALALAQALSDVQLRLDHQEIDAANFGDE